MKVEASTFAVALGERLREVRQGHGWRQDDVAARARGLGMDWSRSVVAAIESGRRQLAAEELLLLPWVVLAELPDLLRGLPPIRIGDNATIDPAAFRYVLDGEVLATSYEDLGDVPALRGMKKATDVVMKRGRTDRVAREEAERYRGVDPGVTRRNRLTEVEAATRGEAEQRVARQFGVEPVLVSLASHRLWDRSLSAERDARVRERIQAGRGDPRVLRGWVTRELLEELVPIIEQHRDDFLNED